MKYALIAFGILAVYVLFAFEYADQIPILKLELAWLQHSIWTICRTRNAWNHSICAIVTLHVFAHQLLEELYFRKSKRWFWYGTNSHWYGNKLHMALVLIPIDLYSSTFMTKGNKSFVCNAFCNKYSGCRNVISFVYTESFSIHFLYLC